VFTTGSLHRPWTKSRAFAPLLQYYFWNFVFQLLGSSSRCDLPQVLRPTLGGAGSVFFVRAAALLTRSGASLIAEAEASRGSRLSTCCHAGICAAMLSSRVLSAAASSG